MENEINNIAVNESEKKTDKKLRPCCACPETRKIRDQCIFERGEEDCLKFIEDHKMCLKEKGFII